MEQLNTSIEAKLQLLKFTNAETPGVVEKQDNASVEGLRNTKSKKVAEVRDLKVRGIQVLRFALGYEKG